MRTAVITGATRGLGLQAARAIAAQDGWRVVLAVRDEARGRVLADELRGDVVPLDLASLAAVRRAAESLRTGPRIDALVLNAGLQATTAAHATADGFERTFAVNHLAHALLAEELIDHLTPAGHVVLVASGTHFGDRRRAFGYPAPRWREDPRDLAVPHDGSGQVAYATSKLANVMFGLELARRVAPGVRVNVYDPGLMPATGLAREYPAPVRLVYRALAPALALLPGASTPRRSGRLLADLATGRRHAGTTGRYIAIEKPIEPAAPARDRAAQATLRAATDEMTGRRPASASASTQREDLPLEHPALDVVGGER